VHGGYSDEKMKKRLFTAAATLLLAAQASTRAPGVWTITGTVDGAAAIPLPASLPLLMAGLMGLGFWRKSKGKFKRKLSRLTA
jgi:hypothetical protein